MESSEVAPLHPILSGISGEYFVAAELSRRGYMAALTLKNTRSTDILVSNAKGQSIRVQVKTNRGRNKKWLLTESHETVRDADLFYVFVNLNSLGAPQYHIVSSDVVASRLVTDVAAWVAGTKKDGSPRKLTAMRAFTDKDGKHKDAWDVLGLD